MPYFEFVGEDASRKSERAVKYWEITQVGKNVTVRFGKIGADGQLKVKEFETKEEAEAEGAKLIKEKTKKGYIEKPKPNPKTDFDSRALILGQLWVNFKSNDEWTAFFAYSDLGLPLAFAFAEGIVNHTPTLEQYINETWDLFIEGLGIEDEGFARLEDIFEEE